MSVKTIKDVITLGLNKANELLCNENISKTTLQKIYEINDGYEVLLFNFSIKVEGSNNDPDIETKIRTAIMDEVTRTNDDIIEIGFKWNSRGYFYIILQIKSEYKKKQKIERLTNKVRSVEADIHAFNLQVFSKIKTQLSKKKTCFNCDSNITITTLKSHKCPCCDKEMYTDTERGRFEILQSKLNAAEKYLKAEVDV
jgi:predicted RNA-binding Zn-ribbon protein involved in translation (DUF1610 family)